MKLELTSETVDLMIRKTLIEDVRMLLEKGSMSDVVLIESLTAVIDYYSNPREWKEFTDEFFI